MMSDDKDDNYNKWQRMAKNEKRKMTKNGKEWWSIAKNDEELPKMTRND